MEKIVDYKVIMGNSVEKVAYDVQRAIEPGGGRRTPLGGVSLGIDDEGEPVVVQAMVRYKGRDR